MSKSVWCLVYIYCTDFLYMSNNKTDDTLLAQGILGTSKN